jgi:hypothetical protein
MSLNRLATIELQLIFHYCDTLSRLQLALCCTHTLTAASNSFTWKYANSFTPRHFPAALKSHVSASEQYRSMIYYPLNNRSSSFFQFIPIALKWNVCASSSSDIIGTVGTSQRADNIIDQICVVKNIRELSLFKTYNEINLISSAQWERLIHHPSMSQLTTFRILYEEDAFLDPPSILSYLPHLLHLHTLQLQPCYFPIDHGRCKWTDILPSIPSLTDLQIGCLMTLTPSGSHAVFQPISECQNLERLTLSNIHSQDIFKVFQIEPHSSNTSMIRELTLEWMNGYTRVEDWESFFRSIPRLEKLSLRTCAGVNKILQALSQIDNLKLFELYVCPIRFDHNSRSNDVPSNYQLKVILDTFPLIKLSLHMLPRQTCMDLVAKHFSSYVPDDIDYDRLEKNWRMTLPLFNEFIQSNSNVFANIPPLEIDHIHIDTDDDTSTIGLSNSLPDLR